MVTRCRAGYDPAMGATTHKAILWMIVGISWVALIGCESAETPPEATKRSPPTVAQPSPWQTADGSAQVAVPNEADDPQLAEAIAEARRTVDQARQRWLSSTEQERLRWTVKWAAPTVNGGVEHLWVKPILHWSPFRIEGRLANPPQAELASGRGLGETVSFPVEELSDWAYLLQGRIDGEHEGGFTVELLEQRYGQPD